MNLYLKFKNFLVLISNILNINKYNPHNQKSLGSKYKWILRPESLRTTVLDG